MKAIAILPLAALCVAALVFEFRETRAAGPVSGRYLEARNAAVFAGPCHINGEAQSQGREALLAWKLDSGSWNETDLAGMSVVAAVSSNENLDEGASRRAVVYLDERIDAAEEAAALDWLRTLHADALGTIERVRRVPIDFSFEGDDYDLRVAGVARLEGAAIADRSCCTMPSDVWYGPVASVEEEIVGFSSTCRFEGDGDFSAWAYEDENNAFVASFSAKRACCASSCPDQIEPEPIATGLE